MKQRPSADRLAQALAAGEPDAYAALYDRLGRKLFRVACAMLGQADQAEDAVQDVFVSLAKSRRRLGEVEDIEAYVFASLRYVVSARVKRRKRESLHLRQLAMIRRDSQAAVLMEDPMSDELAQLPPEQREVIVLKIDGGLTFKQIAGVLGVSQNTAASRYRYAIEKLRARLEELS
jgi:RNA polymerase sigma-70 factor (ECF subfamily)